MRTTCFVFHRNRRADWLAWQFLLGLLFAVAFTPAVQGASLFWTGAVNGYWSEPGNWDPSAIPQNGDRLNFTRDNDAHRVMTNDLVNLSIRTLYFGIFILSGGNNDHNYELHGNTVYFSADAILFSTPAGSSSTTIHCPLVFEDGGEVRVRSESSNVFLSETAELRINGSVRVNAGRLQLGAAGFDPIGPGGHTGRLRLAGSLSGAGSVVINSYSDSSVEFIGPANNTLSGTMYLSTEEGGSEIIFNKTAGYVVTNVLSVVSRGEARLKFSLPNQFGPNSTILLSEAALLRLSGASQVVGSLVFSNRLLSSGAPPMLDTGDTTCVLSGGITSSVTNRGLPPIIKGRLDLTAGDHRFVTLSDGYAGLEIQATIVGAGGFTKAGEAALLLNGANTFSGNVIAAEGVIEANSPTAFGATSGSVILNDGSITLPNLSISGETLVVQGQQPVTTETTGSLLTSVGVSAWMGPIELHTNLVIVFGDMTLGGAISGPGGLALHSGGTVRISGSLNNTYTGTTLVRSPLVEFNKTGGAKAFAGPLIVGGTTGGPYEARWLQNYQGVNPSVTLFANGLVNLNNRNEDFASIAFMGGTVTMGTGELGLSGGITANVASAMAQINGRLRLPAGFHSFTIHDGPSLYDLWIDAVVLGPGHLEKHGTGSLLLSGANTYDGLTTVLNGVLVGSRALSLGSAATGTIVRDGATLWLVNPDGNVGETISLIGAGMGGVEGALKVTGAVFLRNQFPSIYAALDLTTNATIRVEPGGLLTADGFVSGFGGLRKLGPGTLVFSQANANTYAGDTIIQEGTLELRKPANVIAVTGNLIIGPATASSPAAVRWFQAGGMTAGSTATVNANSLLDLNGNNQTLNRLNLNDGGNAQTGAGSLSFPSGGPVTVGSLSGLGSQAGSSFSGRIGLPANGTLSFAVSPYALGAIFATAPELDVSALLPAPVENVNFERAGIYKTGAGQMRLNITGVPALDNRGGNNSWTGPIILARDSSISVAQDWSLTTTGVISGPGSLTKAGAGTLWLAGAHNNTHTGNTFVHEGWLGLSKPPFLQAVPANLIIGKPGGGTTASVLYVSPDQVWGDITVNNGGGLNLNDYDEYMGTLTLNGGGDVFTGRGILTLSALSVNPGGFADQSLIAGRLGLFPGTIPFTVGPGSLAGGMADCLISATINQYSTLAGLQKNGSGRLQLTGTNTYTGNTTVSGGTIQIDGLQPQSPVQVNAGTSLKGSGSVGHITLNGSSSSIAPGSSPGILTSSNFNPGALGSGTLQIELNGLTPGSGHDQMNVRGTVNLAGITLSATLGFASAVSNQFRIINNDGIDAVTNRFTGLPNDARLSIGGELFQINYAGGNGNDVVLTRLLTPPRPVLTIERVLTNTVRLLWTTNDPLYQLQSNTNLNTPTWLAVAPLPSVIATNNVVTNAIGNDWRFYRLFKP